MTITSEKSLREFEWWSGAVANAEMLTYEELDQLETILEDIYMDGINETELNDLMWFEFDWVCEMLGLNYNAEKDEIIRDED